MTIIWCVSVLTLYCTLMVYSSAINGSACLDEDLCLALCLPCYTKTYHLHRTPLEPQIHRLLVDVCRREVGPGGGGPCRPQDMFTSTTPRTPPTSKSNATSDPLENFRAMYPVNDWKSLGMFTDEYMKLINRHWMKFPPPNPNSHYSMAVLYTILMCMGVSGNCLVIFMITRCRSLRTPANILVANLALSDLLMMLKTPVFIYNSIHLRPILGELGCQVYGFVGGMTGIASIFFLAAIAKDRYNVISNPLDPMRKTTRLKAVIWAIFIWCYSILFSSLPLTGHRFKPYVPEGYLTSCSFDYMTEDHFNRVFIFTFFLASWVVPFAIITVCYCGICKAVLDTGMARRGQEKEKRKTELRLALVVVAVIALWFVAWTPYAVVALLGITGKHEHITPLSSMVPAVFCKTASCVDPYVYALSHPRLRKELEKIFCRRRYERERTQTLKTVWRTEASRSSIKGPDGVEEMTVTVEGLRRRHSFDEGSTTSEGTISVPLPDRQGTSPPSWFVPPKPKRNRSTSLKLKSKDETPLTNIRLDFVTA